MRNRFARLLVSALVAALAAVAVLRTMRLYYVVDANNDGQFLWNDREAYLFIGRTQLGWRMNGFDFLYGLTANYAGTVLPVSNKHPSVTVMRYSSAGLEMQTFDNRALGQYIAVENTIYDGMVGRWKGSGFQPTSHAEYERLGEAMRTGLTMVGWQESPHILHRAEPETRFEMTIAGRRIAWVVKRRDELREIILEGADAPVEPVWHVDSRSQRLSRDAYERRFASSPRWSPER